MTGECHLQLPHNKYILTYAILIPDSVTRIGRLMAMKDQMQSDDPSIETLDNMASGVNLLIMTRWLLPSLLRFRVVRGTGVMPPPPHLDRETADECQHEEEANRS